MSDSAIFYTATEVRSYLPTGWVLLDDDAEPTPTGRTWSARVADGADTEWSLEVRAADVQRHGRLAALQREMDRVYREALG